MHTPVILFGNKVYTAVTTRGESLSSAEMRQMTQLFLKHANGSCRVKTDQSFSVDENNEREFQQGTLRLNIRQKFTTGRIASRIERLLGEARK